MWQSHCKENMGNNRFMTLELTSEEKGTVPWKGEDPAPQKAACGTLGLQHSKPKQDITMHLPERLWFKNHDSTIWKEESKKPDHSHTPSR